MKRLVFILLSLYTFLQYASADGGNCIRYCLSIKYNSTVIDTVYFYYGTFEEPELEFASNAEFLNFIKGIRRDNDSLDFYKNVYYLDIFKSYTSAAEDRMMISQKDIIEVTFISTFFCDFNNVYPLPTMEELQLLKTKCKTQYSFNYDKNLDFCDYIAISFNDTLSYNFLKKKMDDSVNRYLHELGIKQWSNLYIPEKNETDRIRKEFGPLGVLLFQVCGAN